MSAIALHGGWRSLVDAQCASRRTGKTEDEVRPWCCRKADFRRGRPSTRFVADRYAEANCSLNEAHHEPGLQECPARSTSGNSRGLGWLLLNRRAIGRLRRPLSTPPPG